MPMARRRDAERNRLRLLAAAAEVVAELGPAAPLTEVASRAGVGAGTLYRHFPTRDALLVAVFDARIDELCDLATGPGRPDAGERLRSWLAAFVEHALTDNGLAETIELARTSPGHDCADRIEAAAGRLLGEARDAGAVTAPIDADQLIRLGIAIAAACDDLDQAEGLLSVVWHGLTGPAAHPVPASSPSGASDTPTTGRPGRPR